MRTAREMNKVRTSRKHGKAIQPHRATTHHQISEFRSHVRHQLLDRLAGDSLVVGAGDSGTGKSSLCRAGVLPYVISFLTLPRAGPPALDAIEEELIGVIET